MPVGVDRGEIPRPSPLPQLDADVLLGGRASGLARVVAVGAEAFAMHPEGSAGGDPRRLRLREDDDAPCPPPIGAQPAAKLAASRRQKTMRPGVAAVLSYLKFVGQRRVVCLSRGSSHWTIRHE